MASSTTDRRLGLSGTDAIKSPCEAATTANITLSGEQTVDGVSCVTGDRVLVKAQTSSVDNGIYVCDTGTWTRDLDFDGPNDVTTGTIVMVLNGSANSNTYWRLTTTGDISFGSSAITFSAALASDSALLNFLQSGTGAVATTVQTKLRYQVSVKDFGAPGDGVTTGDRAAFVLALAAAANTQSKILRVPKGTYVISYTAASELSQLMKVPSGVVIDFEAGAVIKWDYNKLPLFSFINCDGGGFSGRPKFVYTGTTVSSADYTVAQYASQMGLTLITTTGGAYELDCVVMSVGSSNMNWGDPHIESATTGTEGNIIGFAFNLKGLDNAGGYTKNNRIGTLRVYDYVFGVLFSDQQNMVIDQIFSDRRGGTSFYAPSHVVYSTGSSANLLNKDCVIGRITEGRNTINYPASQTNNSATVSVKTADGLRIGSIYTEHEEGPLASVQACINMHIGDMYWKTDDSNYPHLSNPINLVGTAVNGITNDDIHFGNVTFIARNFPLGIALGLGATNSRITFDSVYVECDMNFGAGQSATIGIMDITGTDVTVRKLTIKPSKAITTTVNLAVQFRTGCARCYVDGEVIGQYAKAQLARTADGTSAGGNFSRVVPVYPPLVEDYEWQDAFVGVATNGGLMATTPLALRSYNTVAANTDRSLVTTLPSRGAYLVFADVISPDRTSGRSGWYLVTWTGQAATLNNVQQLGVDITRGATPTALTVTVSTAGVLTIAWTSVSNVFWNAQVGWAKMGSFIT